jgi:hypothetical protein
LPLLSADSSAKITTIPGIPEIPGIPGAGPTKTVLSTGSNRVKKSKKSRTVVQNTV